MNNKSSLVCKKIIKDNIELNIYCHNKTDHIYKHITYYNNKPVFYENYLLEKIRSMNIYGTYIDCGANIGNHSLYFASFTNADKVISIEGHPLIFKILEKNMNTNIKDSKFKILNKLVGDNNNDNNYINLNDNNNCGVGTINFEKKGYNVEMITLDSLDLKNISLIKLDVENFEYNVLIGAKNIIAKYHPVIIIELHNTNPYYNEILLFLKNNNYKTDGINYAKSPTYIYM